MKDPTSSVRVEVEAAEAAAVWSAVEPGEPRRSWGPPVGLALLAALAVAVVWLSSADDEEAAVPAPTVPAAVDVVGDEDVAAADQAVRVPVAVDQRDLHSIASLDGSLIAAANGRSELLWSTDGGTTWEAEVGGSLDGVLAVGESGGDARVLVSVQTPAAESAAAAETMIYRDGQWVLDAERPPVQVASGVVRELLVGSATVAIVEDTWGQPVPEVTNMLAREVDLEIAAATCSIQRRTVLGSLAEYDLLDCDDKIIDTIDVDTIEPGGSVHDQLGFAQEVLRKRTIVHVAAPGRAQERVELGPSQLVLDIAILDDGFVAFVLDSIDVLDNIDFLYSQSFTASLIRWDSDTNMITSLPPPARASAWSANRVVAADDGSLFVVSPIGIHRAEEPFDEWALVGDGEFEPRRPGRFVETALYGGGFFVRDPGLETAMYVSSAGEEWELVDLLTPDYRRVLVSSDDALVFGTVDGQIVRVAR